MSKAELLEELKKLGEHFHQELDSTPYAASSHVIASRASERPTPPRPPDPERRFTEEDMDLAIQAIQFWIRMCWFALFAGTICGFVLGWVARGR